MFSKKKLPLNSSPELPRDKLGISIEYTHSKIIDVSPDTLMKNRLWAFFDDLAISDHYKILRTQILLKTEEEGLNTILVTSVDENEGKSITAANLAITLSKEMEHTVLLVDTDLARPSLHKLFGIEPEFGLLDFLINRCPLSEIIVNPGINSLTLLAGRQNLSGSAEMIGSPRMKQLIPEMKHRYQDRYIIFDSTPVLGCADTLILSQYVDGVILVVEYDRTPKDQIEKAMELLKNTNVVGTVLNKVPVPKKNKYLNRNHNNV